MSPVSSSLENGENVACHAAIVSSIVSIRLNFDADYALGSSRPRPNCAKPINNYTTLNV